MKEFQCAKCKSTNVFISKSMDYTGLYCVDCGAWIKWLLNEEEFHLAKKIITNKCDNSLKEIIKKLDDNNIDKIREACEKVGISITDEKGKYRYFCDILNDLSKAFNS